MNKTKESRTSVPPTTSRLMVKRNGSSITRKIPKPVVLVDTREQKPFTFDQFSNWIKGTVSQKLDAGDYSVQGMEEGLLIMERKSLQDCIITLMQHRERFFRSCEKMSQFRWRALLVEASYEDLKSPKVGTPKHTQMVLLEHLMLLKPNLVFQ